MYDFCEVKHFAALKGGDAIIRGGAIFGGNLYLYLYSICVGQNCWT